MIEINLIPDVKREYLHAQRMRNGVISLSILVSIIAGAAVALLVVYVGTQSAREWLTDNEIKDQYSKISSVKDANQIVTIQNQLAQLSSMHKDKSIDSRIFDVLSAINPAAPNDVKMSTVSLDPSETKLSIEGSAANSFEATDKLKKMILNTKLSYTDGDNRVQTVKLADDVTVSDTSYGEDASGAKVLRFKLTFTYPKELLSNSSKNLRIEAPTGSTNVTDSRLHVPDSLFTPKATNKEKN